MKAFYCFLFALCLPGFALAGWTRCPGSETDTGTSDARLRREESACLRQETATDPARVDARACNGGVDVIYDSVGSAETLEVGVRVARPRGRIVVTGVAPPRRFEWSPLYFKEIAVVGSNAFAIEEWDGRRQHAMEWYFELLRTRRLDVTPILTHRFTLEEYREAFLACGDQVARKKPAPDIYRLTLSSLRLPSEACIAFEDSLNGLRAAKAAGLATVVTPSRWNAQEDFSDADLVLPSLEGLDLPRLERLLGEAHASA